MAYEGKTLPLTGPDDKIHAAARSTLSIDRYLEVYADWNSERYAADVSPNYLPSERTATSIRSYSPDAKIIMVLRNPVEAAYSMFVMMRRDRREPYGSFIKAFEASEERIALGWADGWNLKRYNYAVQVRRFLDAFDRSQLFIHRYEELRDAPARFFDDLREFLGLEVAFDYADLRANAAPTRFRHMRSNPVTGKILKIPSLRRAVPAPVKNLLRGWLQAPAFKMRPNEYNHALAFYAEEIRDLGDLLDWDVSPWLKRR